MQPQTLIVIFVLGLLGIFWYSQQSLKGRLLCYFHLANRTLIEKKVPVSSRFVIFDGGKYKVDPKRISLIWYTRGLHQFFPTYIPSLTFKWDTDQPLDPTTFEHTWGTPEASAASGQEEEFRAFAKGVSSLTKKKGALPEWLLPVITIGLLVVVVYMIYQTQSELSIMRQMIKVK